jgi:murein DD-endopeptidase MepM/ murein hydrolase activator NlpD
MGNSVQTETAEQKAAREARELAEQKARAEKEALAQHQSGEGDIFASIIGFIKFLWNKLLDFFSPDRNAPDEEPQGAPGTRPPQTMADRIRIGKSVIESGAISKWQEFQRTNKGQPVQYGSPLAGDGFVNSDFGMRLHPTLKTMRHHDGVDVVVVSGSQNVVAAAKGIVLFSDYVDGYGNTVVVGHADGRYTLYAHMTGQAKPSLGTQLERGQQIGVVGASGTATGPHLHFEMLEGEKHIPPVIAGVTLKSGTRLARSGEVSDAPFASFVNRDAHPKLPTGSAQTTPVAFASGAKVQSGGVITR